MTTDLYDLFTAILGRPDDVGDADRPAPLGGTSFAGLGDGEAAAALRAFAAELTGDERYVAEGTPADGALSDFMRDGARKVRSEIAALVAAETRSAAALKDAAATVRERRGIWDADTRRALWRFFFPEGAAVDSDRDAAVHKIRRRRAVTVESPNPRPIRDPAVEILFTSNVLVTLPADRSEVGRLGLAREISVELDAAFDEPQRYYYDHPIRIGTAVAANEAVYGLRGLDAAIAFEKARGTVAHDARVRVVLSLSVTHEGLHRAAPAWLQQELAAAGPLEHLEVYLITEPACRRLVAEVIAPLLHNDAGDQERVERHLDTIFGVDGEYGRHYSFLKAIAALWHVLIDAEVRATFKIDLDQVFPQHELVAETGASALEHFTTPLWGASARDRQGRRIELGMIAGALVNERDIARGLFTPDVPRPREIPPGEAAVFYNKLPMALSTEAEMMTRYERSGPRNGGGFRPDGVRTALQRVHVTGGTNGILVAHLRRHRPFTPTFVGRAEDQAYLLSVLHEGSPALRYLHEPGLIMRHDKEAFAGEAIAAAAIGRFVGDLARTFVFSRYADAFPWGLDATKTEIDPFTGCFVTRRTFTVLFLRLALYAAALISHGESREAKDALAIANAKLSPLFEAEGESGRSIAARAAAERDAWRLYYDALEAAERHPGSAVAEAAGEAARRILAGCRLGGQEESDSHRGKAGS